MKKSIYLFGNGIIGRKKVAPIDFNNNTSSFHSFLFSFKQKVLSRDSVTVTVDAVVYYRVSNPTMATNNVEDFR